jgi:hypothetical protein
LEDGKPLVQFPRIWIMALSKSDLLPNLDVVRFRDLLIEKAGDDLVELRKVLAGLVEASDALSVGEDFVLLSSAKFEADKIEVAKRIGLELILPLAAMLPFERHIRWAQTMQIPRKVAENLLDGVDTLARVLVQSKLRLPGPIGHLVNHVGPHLLNAAAKLVGDKLKEANSEALAKHDYLTATLTRFRMDLDKGEKEQILLRNPA